MERLESAENRFRDWQESQEYQDALNRRLKVMDACMRDKQSKALAYSVCKEDPVFFIETFGWVYDPRPEYAPHNLPFIPFQFQKDAIIWIVRHCSEGKDGLIEKSRDMGATWLFIWAMFWMWMFQDSFSGLVGSYKEALVDNRTPDSLFGKFDYCISSVPKFLLPARFDYKKHRMQMKLINPETYNLITGDTMNPNFARGSRKTMVFLDEGASWDYFREAWESAGDTTPCRLTCSTPKGMNAFAKLRYRGDIDVLTLHWPLHPLKDKNWYEFEKSRRTDEEVAQELDISYHKSQENRVYPEFDQVPVGEYPYDASLPLFIAWDFGRADDTAIIWAQKDRDGIIRIVDTYSNRGKTIDFYVPFITGVVPGEGRYSKRDLEMIERHKHWRRGIHFGDPAGRFMNQVTNQSVMDVLRDHGIVVNFREDAKDFQTRKTETKLLMRRLVVNDSPDTDDFRMAIENACYPKVRRGGEEQVSSVKPLHDYTSHFRSALEYLAVNYNKLYAKTGRVKDKFPKKGSALVPY